MQLSIITINYNNLAGLKKTAESIISQTWRDFEWIIIDGGSSDGSKDYIEQLASKPENNISYWCSEPDKGIYNALNKGIGHCNGEYVSCMNSGDCFNDDAVLFKVFTDKPETDVIYGDALYIYEKDQEIRRFPDRLSFRWLYHDTLNHQASFGRKEILRSLLFDESYKIMADRKVWLQMYVMGCSFHHVAIPICIYDTTGVSATNGERWMKEMHRLQMEFVPTWSFNNRFFVKVWKGYWEIKSITNRIIRGMLKK